MTSKDIIFYDLLKKYEDSERYIIGETSSNMARDIAKLESEINGWRELWVQHGGSPSLDFDEETAAKDDDDPFDGMELGNLLFGHSRGKYKIDRERLQGIFSEFLNKIEVDGYGHADYESPLKPFEGSNLGYYKIDTPIFSIMPYYWGDDEEVKKLPNFVYKPENIEIRWYKYPFRDSYSNVPVDEEKMIEITEKCIEWVWGKE